MKVPQPDEERPLAWNAILADTPVYSADGEELGVIHDVLGAEDIFHGLVVRSGPTAEEKMVPAEDVSTITNKRIGIALSAEQVRALPLYQPEASYELGFVGLFRRHLGWVRESEEPGQNKRS
jgi:PRC-barrel domain